MAVRAIRAVRATYLPSTLHGGAIYRYCMWLALWARHDFSFAPPMHSVPNRQFLRRYDGLSLVHHCLERVSPQHMTPGALTQACRLAHRLGFWSEEWADSAIASLLVPSRLWVFAPSDAQLTLVGVLRGLARRCPGRMRRIVGLQRCLDALDLYYWYTPPHDDESFAGDASSAGSGLRQDRREAHSPTGGASGGGGGGNRFKDWSYASKQWLNPSTGHVLGRKASGSSLQEIRARLLDAAVLMTCEGDGVTRADVAAVLGYLRGCRDDLSRCEALRLVLRLIEDPRQAGRFAIASGYVATDTYVGDDGPDEFPHGGPFGGPDRGGAAIATYLSLLRASDPTVRVLALLAFAQVSRLRETPFGLHHDSHGDEGCARGSSALLLFIMRFRPPHLSTYVGMPRPGERQGRSQRGL